MADRRRACRRVDRGRGERSPERAGDAGGGAARRSPGRMAKYARLIAAPATRLRRRARVARIELRRALQRRAERARGRNERAAPLGAPPGGSCHACSKPKTAAMTTATTAATSGRSTAPARTSMSGLDIERLRGRRRPVADARDASAPPPKPSRASPSIRAGTSHQAARSCGATEGSTSQATSSACAATMATASRSRRSGESLIARKRSRNSGSGEMQDDEGGADQDPAGLQARHVPGDFAGQVLGPDDQQLHEGEIGPEQHAPSAAGCRSRATAARLR